MRMLRLTFTIHIKRETFCQIIENLRKMLQSKNYCTITVKNDILFHMFHVSYVKRGTFRVLLEENNVKISTDNDFYQSLRIKKLPTKHAMDQRENTVLTSYGGPLSRLRYLRQREGRKQNTNCLLPISAQTAIRFRPYKQRLAFKHSIS
jgi:hypothetical protein